MLQTNFSKGNLHSINLNILECKGRFDSLLHRRLLCINLNILECKDKINDGYNAKWNSINLNILECKGAFFRKCCTKHLQY